jgi:CheY-like chemotaxis protein
MSGTRILVVDDDAWISKMVANVLERRGYAITICQDGEEAYHTALDLRPDLIITDVMMPRVDGFALVRALRAKPELAFTPVIFLTALNSDDDRIKGFRLGCDDYLPKPFRFEELDLRVERVLRRTVVLRETAQQQVGGSGGSSPSPLPTAPARGTDVNRPVTGMLGSLEEIGLAALLTLLEVERKTGILTLWNEREPARATSLARIFVRGGTIVAAEIDPSAAGAASSIASQIDLDEAPRNADCIYHLLTWSRGRFEFAAAVVDGLDEIRASITHLLLEGARRLDEDR